MSKQARDVLKSENSPIITSLYNLIHSLTQAQKRDFTKYAKFWGGTEAPKYLRLFDIINRYVVSGKEKQHLSTHILKSKHFQTKHAMNALADYLITKILDSVRSTPEASPRTNRLHSMLQDINFLYNKGLNEECYNFIREAMKQAKAIDKSAYLMELYVWERRILPSVRGVEEMAKRVKEMSIEEQQLVQNIQGFFELNTLSNDIFLSLKQNLPLSDGAASKINEFLNHDEAAYLKTQSLRAHYWYYNSLYYYHEFMHKQKSEVAGEEASLEELRKALANLDALISLSQNEGNILAAEEPAMLNTLIDNYLNLCIRLGESERIEQIAENLRSGKNETQFLRSAAFYQLVKLVGDINGAAAVAYIEEEQLSKRLSENENSIGASRLMSIRYTCGQAYFLNENYDEASNWFRLIVESPNSRDKPNVLLVSEFQQIISLFELNVYERDPLRPLHNFVERLRNHGKSTEFLEMMFTVLKCAFSKKNQELAALIPPLYNKVIKNATLKNNFGLVMAWLESRCNGTTVAEEVIKYTKKIS